MIVVVHNIIAPYRTPLFNKLSQSLGDFAVLYSNKKDTGRRWDQDSSKLSHDARFLSTLNILKFNFSYDLIYQLFHLKPKYVFCLDDDKNFLNFLQVVFFSYFFGYQVISWCGLYKDRNISILTRILNLIRGIAYKRVSKTWAYSNATKGYMVNKFHLDESSVFIGLQGYPSEIVKYKSTNSLESRYSKKSLVFVGYIDHRKGLEYPLLSAFKKYSNANPETKLSVNVIGDCDYLERLRKTYENYNVKFYGHLDGEEKYAVIDESSFLILPSHDDPWGWVVNEASLLSLPCIVSTNAMSNEMTASELIVAPTAVEFENIFKKLEKMSMHDYITLSRNAKFLSEQHSLSKTIESFHRIISI